MNKTCFLERTTNKQRTTTTTTTNNVQNGNAQGFQQRPGNDDVGHKIQRREKSVHRMKTAAAAATMQCKTTFVQFGPMVVRADAKQGQKGMKEIIEIGMVVEAVQVLTEVDLVVVVVVVVVVWHRSGGCCFGRLSKHGNTHGTPDQRQHEPHFKNVVHGSQRA